MIDARTELYGVIGNPVRHSLSPVLHNGVFRRVGLNAVYMALEVKNLREALGGIRSLGIRGVSVTIPFKTEIVSLLDDMDDLSKEIGAVNTISNEGGRLIGFNTDSHGAIAALEEKVDLKNKTAILLGAGGAARAIGFGLKDRKCQMVLFNRSRDRGEALARELGCEYYPLSSLDKMEGDVILNATSVGMAPHDRESPIPEKILEEGMVVMDIVYWPLRTRFLREAESRGCVTIDGIEMLARQGAAQIEIWTGLRPEIEKIKKDLYQVLGIENDRGKDDD